MSFFWYLSCLLPRLFYKLKIFLFLFCDAIQCEICFYEYALINLTICSVLQLSNGIEQLTMGNSLQPTDHGTTCHGQQVVTGQLTTGQFNSTI